MAEQDAIEIRIAQPNDPAVGTLLEALSLQLSAITGRDGKDSFAYSDVMQPRSIFLVAYRIGQPIGCGSLRPISDQICELKRMYAHEGRRGIGSRILEELERHAKDLGYSSIWLETGIQNQVARDFYVGHGYRIRENYGKYVGRSECICFEKQLFEQYF